MRKIFLILCLSFLFNLSAENISFDQASIFTFNSENKNETECHLDIDDVLILTVEDTPFLKGIEMEVFQEANSTFFCSLYPLQQLPKENEKQCNVDPLILKETLQQQVQAKKTFTFQIPIDDKSKLSSSHIVKVLPYFLNEKTSPILIKFSSETTKKEGREEKLKIKLKPLFQDVGGIKFNIIYPPPITCFNTPKSSETEENKEVAIKVDDKYIKDISKIFMTRVGQHKIQVDSHFYKGEMISCLIEKGKVEVVDVFLKSTIPFLSIEGPSSTTVYLDDKKIKLPFSSHVTYGNHVIRVQLDGYEIVRSLKTEEGKTYLLNVALDIKLIEN
ncbi:MAG: hypothetical protein ACTTJ3_07930 [Treponema sp.]